LANIAETGFEKGYQSLYSTSSKDVFDAISAQVEHAGMQAKQLQRSSYKGRVAT
jgi:hypothetical protein